MHDGSPVQSHIPDFVTTEEEAQFWDIHDTTEFAEEWEPVGLEVGRPLMHRLTIRLEGPVFHRLVAIAKRRGVPTSALAATLIREAVEQADDLEAEDAPERKQP